MDITLETTVQPDRITRDVIWIYRFIQTPQEKEDRIAMFMRYIISFNPYDAEICLYKL